jgi:hypothetical protein
LTNYRTKYSLKPTSKPRKTNIEKAPKTILTYSMATLALIFWSCNLLHVLESPMVILLGGGEGVVKLLGFEFQFLKIINFNFENETNSSLVLSNPIKTCG